MYGCPFGCWHNPPDELVLLGWVVNHSLYILLSDCTVCNVVHHSVVEEDTVLGHNSDLASQVSESHLGDVLAIDEDLTCTYIIESVEEPHYCALPRSCLAYDTNRLTCSYFERNIIDHSSLFSLWELGVIGEADVSELDVTFSDVSLDWVFSFRNPFIDLKEVEDHLHVDHILPDESPKGAKKAERSVDLQVIAVEHDEATDGQFFFQQEIVGQAKGATEA